MTEYKYKAVTPDGKTHQGVFSAESDLEVVKMIRERNWYPVDVKLHSSSSELELKFLNKVTTKDISVFCRQFATMINAGITIVSVIEIIEKQTHNKKMKSTLKQVFEDVQKGATFSESLKANSTVFPSLLTNMVEAGEASGNLDKIMDRMAVHYEKDYKINNKVKSAMMYPVILGIVSFTVVVFLLTFVLPSFVSIFESSGTELPAPTRALLFASSALKTYWFLFMPITAASVFFIYKYFKTAKGKYIIDRIKLRAPIIRKPAIDIVTSRFTRTLSILFSSGVPLIQALDITSAVVQNSVIEKRTLELKERIRQGHSLSKAVKDVEEFPLMMKSMIGVGEESGTLDDILDKTANFYDEEVEVALEKLTTLIEPVMIILMALIVGFIVMAIALPMFGMFESIQTGV